MEEYHLRQVNIKNVVVGSGAAGFNAASRLYQFGEHDVAVIAESVNAGTSRNTGSDKQTYYKLSLAGGDEDSVRNLAEDLFAGQCVDGDLALCEAALSSQCFYHLVELGVPFPCNEFCEFMGYKTDHDRGRRATSAGPYTSKIMTECLERDIRAKGIPILDGMQAIRLLTSGQKLRGVLCLERTKTDVLSFVIVWCENLILATGGPAGIYHDSVYPESQLGSSGIAFEAGVLGKNLTEWQFGLASLRPRWNVSGTYMQVLPRFVSTAQDGSDEREFLMDYFSDRAELLSLVFLKGYQWPFDTNKIFGGSSLIDLLVYQETILKGRRVFLDYRENPGGADVPYQALREEAYQYLSSAGACFGTPIQRLAQMNGPAIQFYEEHGVDLYHEMLEIAVCAQHNNGGLATDANWETNVEGLFAVGEVCGSHGVTRPGGTALNAGQVGSYRAADYIAHLKKGPQEDAGDWASVCMEQAKACIELFFQCCGESSLNEIWNQSTTRMSRYGGMIRDEGGLRTALDETDTVLAHFTETVRQPTVTQAALFYHLRDMLLAQKTYLFAMYDYVSENGGSRGSALYSAPDGEKPGEALPDLYRCNLDQGRHGAVIQEIELLDGKCRAKWRPVREIPSPDYFFETQWKLYRERRNI